MTQEQNELEEALETLLVGWHGDDASVTNANLFRWVLEQLQVMGWGKLPAGDEDWTPYKEIVALKAQLRDLEQKLEKSADIWAKAVNELEDMTDQSSFRSGDWVTADDLTGTSVLGRIQEIGPKYTALTCPDSKWPWTAVRTSTLAKAEGPA